MSDAEKGIKIISNVDLPKEQFVQALAGFLSDGMWAEKSSNAGEREAGEKNGKSFTIIVDMLRKDFPDQRIRDLASDLWNLVNNMIVPTVMIPNFKYTQSISFMALGSKDGTTAKNGSIIVPVEYYKLIRSNPIMAAGGVLFVASQARDYWNGKLSDPDAVVKRSKAYEATYLHLVLKMPLASNYTPTSYQQDIIKAYPGGLDDIAELLYECQSTPLENTYPRDINKPPASNVPGRGMAQ